MKTFSLSLLSVALLSCSACNRTQSQSTSNADVAADSGDPDQGDGQSASSPQDQPSGAAHNAVEETIVCSVSYERGGAATEQTLRINVETQRVSHDFDDLGIIASYTPPGPEGNVLMISTGLAGQTSNPLLSRLFQFPGGEISDFNIGGHGFTGLVRVFHPSSGAILSYSCIKQGVGDTQSQAGATPAPQISTIHCSNTYRRSQEVALEHVRDLELDSSSPQQSSAFTSLTLRTSFDHGASPQEMVFTGLHQGSNDPRFEVRYGLDRSFPDHVFAGRHGFTGLSFAHHANDAELQFHCSTAPIVR